jgi:hypothetical protein
MVLGIGSNDQGVKFGFEVLGFRVGAKGLGFRV